jgi:HD-GYP domain-containing protein (c-di-GMP phosphodiesterase class II)
MVTSRHGGRWVEHRWLAFGLRAAVLVLPATGALAASFLASRAVARPSDWAGRALWWTGMLALSTAVLVVVDRQARRLIPLAVLLRLSLVFPDRVPSRWGIAMRTGTTNQLRKRIAETEATGATAAEAASWVLALAAALNAHDRRTRGHAERVRGYVALIADEMGLSAPERDKLNWVALLHDIGKLQVRAAVLNKRGPLTASEREEVERHPAIGGRLVAPLAAWLAPWARGVQEHS